MRVGADPRKVRHHVKLVDETLLPANDGAERLRELEVASFWGPCVTGGVRISKVVRPALAATWQNPIEKF